MAARPIWKGQLRLSLVAIPVELYSASNSSAKLSFRQIHGPSGKPVRYQKIVPGIGPIDEDDIFKGYEYEDNNYLLLSDDEIQDIKLETKKTMELTQFVGACEIDPIYFNKPYFIVPQDDLAEDAFRVIRDALRQSEKIGLGQLSLRGKEYLAAVKPTGSGLLLETLHYENEIRESDAFFSTIDNSEAESDLVKVARELIEKKTAAFDAGVFKDNYAAALRDLIDRKLGDKSPTVETDETDGRQDGGNVIDLMSALKSSLENSGKKAGAKPTARSGKTRSAGKDKSGKTVARASKARGGRKAAG